MKEEAEMNYTDEQKKEIYELRGRMLEDACKKYGRKNVSKWADDPVKVKIVNAMAMMMYDKQIA